MANETDSFTEQLYMDSIRLRSDLARVTAERDAAIARAEKAERRLTENISRLDTVKTSAEWVERVSTGIGLYYEYDYGFAAAESDVVVGNVKKWCEQRDAAIAARDEAVAGLKALDAMLLSAWCAHDEIGIQFTAAQARIKQLEWFADRLRDMRDSMRGEPCWTCKSKPGMYLIPREIIDIEVGDKLRALDTVSGDALAPVVTDEAVKVGCAKWSDDRITAALVEASGIDTANVKGGE